MMLRLRQIITLWISISTFIYANSPTPWQMGLQEAVTPIMENITHVHNILLAVIFSIAILVVALILYVIYRFRASKNPIPDQRSHHVILEIFWTLVPALILICVGIPSVRILYQNDKAQHPEITIKAIGHQWYWTYEIKDGEKQLSFDSYMINDEDLKPGQLRTLEVDNRVIVPVNTTVQLLTTSADVLHSYAVPAFGIKKDSVPGRINETWFRVSREGVYYGQCSELCGIKHGFMPIVIEVVARDKYTAWRDEKMKKS